MAFLDALRGSGDDAIRQSTSLTMAYLLEQNRKFEAYMRQKVVELEARVAGQQARLELPRLSGQAEEEGEPPDFDGAKESADVDTTDASAETGALLAAALMKGLSPPEGGTIWSASGNQLSQDMSLLDDPTPEDTPSQPAWRQTPKREMARRARTKRLHPPTARQKMRWTLGAAISPWVSPRQMTRRTTLPPPHRRRRKTARATSYSSLATRWPGRKPRRPRRRSRHRPVSRPELPGLISRRPAKKMRTAGASGIAAWRPPAGRWRSTHETADAPAANPGRSTPGGRRAGAGGLVERGHPALQSTRSRLAGRGAGSARPALVAGGAGRAAPAGRGGAGRTRDLPPGLRRAGGLARRGGPGGAIGPGPLDRAGHHLESGQRQRRRGAACWLSIPEGWGDILRRLVGDVFPGGQVEAGEPPAPGQGAVILRWQDEAPALHTLCRLDGVEGARYRWRNEETATVALWGPGAGDVARRFAASGDLLDAEGEALRRPPFTGDNPWPGLPSFPPSQANPGLAAVSRLERLAPALRVTGPTLVIGRDAEDAPVGFALPHLIEMKSLWVIGQAAEKAAVSLAARAVQAGIATFFLDGQGAAASRLSRRLLREAAAGRVLACDVERPAQTRFRLNPFWLPAAAETWPRGLAAWLDWLRELGVTPAGLGQAAYRHSRVAVVLAALVAAGQGWPSTCRGCAARSRWPTSCRWSRPGRCPTTHARSWETRPGIGGWPRGGLRPTSTCACGWAICATG